MPLAFQTINRGQIAFGFFNIESDMLLLQQYFFFAEDFCDFVSDCAKQPEWTRDTKFEVFEIADSSDIGDLMGAINGIRHTGFIGKTYRRFPFPENPDDFKQNPQGFATQEIFREMIIPFAETVMIPFHPLTQHQVRIGKYIFSQTQFMALLEYVERGGMPRWRDEIRPDYVRRMVLDIRENRNRIFSGFPGSDNT